ncbi:MAG: type II secretion system protein [Candidatus Omnitrophica bacterium]|nr:type II secretion system protein [Candidatus Omnitrophota bacterium]
MGNNNSKGFTLVEIMIVVAIIGLLVALGIPSLLRARLSANETNAQGSLRTIITALENYRADQNPPTYPTELDDLKEGDPAYLDPFPEGGRKHGYEFYYYASDPINYTIGGEETTIYPAYSISSIPLSDGFSGNARFFTNSSGVIYADKTIPYTDPPDEYSAEVPEEFIPTA